VEKIAAKSSAKKNDAPAITAPTTLTMPVAVHPARSARSGSSAPILCPTIAATAAPIPTDTTYTTLSMRNPRPSAAKAGVPNCVVMRVSTT